MKLVVQTKLLPSPEQAEALAATLAACNAAANWVSRVGWEAEHADVNAAVNLSVSGWAVVNQPGADMPLAASEAV